MLPKLSFSLESSFYHWVTNIVNCFPESDSSVHSSLRKCLPNVQPPFDCQPFKETQRSMRKAVCSAHDLHNCTGDFPGGDRHGSVCRRSTSCTLSVALQGRDLIQLIILIAPLRPFLREITFLRLRERAEGHDCEFGSGPLSGIQQVPPPTAFYFIRVNANSVKQENHIQVLLLKIILTSWIPCKCLRSPRCLRVTWKAL